MITRIYIDNYRCFNNFELGLGPMNLLLGDNGSGKSSVFDVLAGIREMVLGHCPALFAFPARELCRWISADRGSARMRFGIQARIPDPWKDGPDPEAPLEMEYGVVIEHEVGQTRASVRVESLRIADRDLFLFEDGEVSLFGDDGTVGPRFPADQGGSALAAVPDRRDNRRLTAFRALLDDIRLLRLVPCLMRDHTTMYRDPSSDVRLRRQALELSASGEDAADWLYEIHAEYGGFAAETDEAFQAIIPQYTRTRFPQQGDARTPRIDTALVPRGLRLSELSDGQRALIVLYTLLYSLPPRRHALFIDEPDNYVALGEIQPWLRAASGRAGHEIPQVVLISHHPEAIDYLAGANAVYFWREDGRHTRCRPVSEMLSDEDDTLRLSERIARGWLDA